MRKPTRGELIVLILLGIIAATFGFLNFTDNPFMRLFVFTPFTIVFSGGFIVMLLYSLLSKPKDEKKVSSSEEIED